MTIVPTTVRFIQGSNDHCSYHRGRFKQGGNGATVPTTEVDLHRGVTATVSTMEVALYRAVLSHVWHLVVSIPKLCTFTYYYTG